MQIPFSNSTTRSLKHQNIRANLRSLITPMRSKITRKRQMSANELLTLLETALDKNLTVTLQCNVSLYTESIYELTGLLTLGSANQLILLNTNNNISTIVWPQTLRNIMLHT